MALRLHVAAHDAKRCVQLARLGRHRRDDRVIGALVRRQHVGVVGIQDEQRRPVLQAHASAGDHQPRAAPPKEAVDKAGSVALAIDDAEVDGIGAGAGIAVGHALRRRPRIDALAPPLGVP